MCVIINNNFISNTIFYVFENEKNCSSFISQVSNLFGKEMTFDEICEHIIPYDAVDLVSSQKSSTYFNKDQKILLIKIASKSEEAISVLLRRFKCIPKYALPIIIINALTNFESTAFKVIENKDMIKVLSSKNYVKKNFPIEYQDIINSYITMAQLI